MNQSLLNEPVATSNPALSQGVDECIASNEPLVALIRYAKAAGSKDYFLVRHAADFGEVLARCRPKDSVTVFFPAALPIRGRADEHLLRDAIQFLAGLQADDPDAVADLIRLDVTDFCLTTKDMTFFSSTDDIAAWFSDNSEASVAIGQLAFWLDNCDEVVTAYVPDPDGVIRPGAY